LRILMAILSLGLWAAMAVRAQLNPEISGLYEHQLTLSDRNNDTYWSAQNQFRLTFRANPVAKVSAEATLAAISYHGLTEVSPADYVPERLRDQVSSSSVILEDRVFLDRAMADIFIRQIRFQIGIQPLRWGAGYAWNPTDLFTTKSPVDPGYIEEGVSAVKATFPWRKDGHISAILVPEATWGNSGKGIRWLDYLLGFDMSVCYLERTLFPIPIQSNSGKERYLGWDLTGELMGPGLWSEGTVLLDPDRDDPVKIVVGLDYTTFSGWYVKLEGYHNGDGAESAAEYTVDDWLEAMYRPNIFLGKDYVLAGVEKTAGDLWRLSLYGIGNLSDRSLVVNPWVYYDIAMSSEVIVSAAIPVGADLDEFHTGNASGFIRLHVYF
jgi:hypothetical protein